MIAAALLAPLEEISRAFPLKSPWAFLSSPPLAPRSARDAGGAQGAPSLSFLCFLVGCFFCVATMYLGASVRGLRVAAALSAQLQIPLPLSRRARVATSLYVSCAGHTTLRRPSSASVRELRLYVACALLRSLAYLLLLAVPFEGARLGMCIGRPSFLCFGWACSCESLFSLPPSPALLSLRFPCLVFSVVLFACILCRAAAALVGTVPPPG